MALVTGDYVLTKLEGSEAIVVCVGGGGWREKECYIDQKMLFAYQ